ncbi:hypothetical protein MKW92_001201 [Papaver armeniacum]|nr:hypothetical protein MKW92_001201 [Papaver armeniacum]
MKSDDVTPDSCNVWMRALVASSDISGVERVYKMMDENAEEALKELGKRSHKSHNEYKLLIKLYRRTGNLLEVYRVWAL